MKTACIALSLALGLAATAHADTGADTGAVSNAPAAGADSERIAFLVAQDQRHSADIARLEAEIAARPKSREEAFAACMQAARGQTSAMAAESIGSHCDRLLK